jgi:hypothetical protein
MRELCRKIHCAEGTTHETMVANDSQGLERVLTGMQRLSKGRQTKQKGCDATTTTSNITCIS